MRYITLDECVRSAIIEEGRSIHWYFQFLKLATDCLTELHKHTLKSSRIEKVAVSDAGEVIIPCDAVDVVGMWNHDRKSRERDGKIDIIRTEGNKLYVPRVQCLYTDSAYIEIITDGRCDAGSKVNFLAKRTIITYILWKNSPNKANHQSPEGRVFYNELRILRANRWGTTVEDIKQVLRNQTHWNPDRYQGDPLKQTFNANY